jgi:Spy/CpxP family protein refolding chaperone
MKNLLSISMLALLALNVVPASAQDAQPAAPDAKVGGGEGKRGGGRHGKLMTMLNADQKEKFKAIMQASRDESRPLFEKMQALKDASKGQGSFDEKSKTEFVALRKQLSENRKATQQKILAILTPEQKVEFEKNKGFGGRGGDGNWGGRKHRRGGGEGGPVGAPAAPAQ